MVFKEVLLNLIQLACQLTYFNRQANWIEFIKTFSDSDMQHNDERQCRCFKQIIYFLQHVEDLHHAVKQRAIYLQPHEKDPQHNDKNLHGFFGFFFFCVLQQTNQGNKIYLYIFESMLMIFITLSNREQFICDSMRKILSTMTKFFMISLVCLCVFFLK